ncbi:MAG: glucose-6-phosphate dehydrogenase assembly protein OpcA [Armatimonadota bacterium]
MADDGAGYSMEQKMTSEIKRVSGTGSVGISSIDTELTRLWENEAVSQTGTNSVPSMRVCTASLIVFAPCNDLHETITKTIELIAGEHPLRVICLYVNEDSDEASVHITGFCKLIDGGGMHICCEQITITAGTHQISDLTSAAAELISPGLPVYLWWMCNSYIGSEAYEILVSLADKVMFDSEIESPSSNMISVIADQINAHNGITIHDINWHRITNWREALARIFDLQQYNRYLSEIQKVEIHYRKDDLNGIYHPIYLTGWLQSRLGWHVHKQIANSNDIIQIDMLNQTGSEITIALHPDITDISSESHIRWLSVSCGDGTIIKLESIQNTRKLSVEITDTDNRRSLIEYSSEFLSIEEIVSIELKDLVEDTIFRDALLSAIEILS